MLNLIVEGQWIRARLSHDVNSGGIIISPQGKFMGLAVTDGVQEEIITMARNMVAYLPTEETFDTEFQDVYLRTANLKIVGSPLPVLTPPDPVLTLAAGGTLSDGAYYYAVTVEDGYGESVVSTSVPDETVSGVNRTIEVDFPLVSGATSYNIYRGIAPDSLYWIANVVGSPLIDDGSYPASSVEPPSYNKTGTQHIGQYVSGYNGTITIKSSMKIDPDGSIHRVEWYDTQRIVPAGNIPILFIS